MIVSICDVHLYAACNVANAETYGSACEVSSCNTGWRVSDDKSECVANKCSCPDGTASSGANCPSDGANGCRFCDPGFELDAEQTACTGPFGVVTEWDSVVRQ